MSNKLKLQVYNQNNQLLYTKELQDRNSLPKLVKENDCPVSFCCLQGFCGACLVSVIDGAEVLEAPNENEALALDEFSIDSNARLFCQAKIKTLETDQVLKVKINTY